MIMVFIFSALLLVFAPSCPIEMIAIDPEIGSATDPGAENITKVKTLCTEGKKFHKKGKQGESMKSFQKPKKLPGI